MSLELLVISHHQGAVDFDAVIASGIAGVIVKATEGRAPTVDSRFAENCRALRERSDQLVAGYYSFCRPNTDGGGAEDGRAEAEHFCRTLLDAGVRADEDFIAAPDFEMGGTNPDHSAQQNLDFIAAWEETCVKMLDRSPWLYTGKNVWRQRCAWSDAFVHLPLWVASYTSRPPEMPWPQPTLWQYTGSGSCPGVSGNVDRNRFEGSLEQLRKLARPHVYGSPPAVELERGIHAAFDLSALDSSTYDGRVALVQGGLLAHGYGPDGLVGSDGRPDGKAGSKTKAALSQFRAQCGLTDAPVFTGADWWALASEPTP